jgi:hypothetical protein
MKDRAKGQVYSAECDVEDGRAFLDRGSEDRHQFRFIVSSEDGVELSDLRTTTRDLMQQMEADLGTKLEWIAVDHHNTGYPHSHSATLRTRRPSSRRARIDHTFSSRSAGFWPVSRPAVDRRTRARRARGAACCRAAVSCRLAFGSGGGGVPFKRVGQGSPASDEPGAPHDRADTGQNDTRSRGFVWQPPQFCRVPSASCAL